MKKVSGPKLRGKALLLSWQELIMGVALALLGVVLLIWPNLVPSMVLIGIGAISIVVGLVYVARYFMQDAEATLFSGELSIGLIWIVAGVLAIALKNLLISLLPILCGAVVVLGGIAKLSAALSFRRLQLRRWYVELIGAIVSVVLGALILFNPFSTAMLLMRIIGAALLIEGVQDLISVYAYKRAKNAYFIKAEARDITEEKT